MTRSKYSLVVIGAGAGGLVVAIGGAKAGKKVLLIEKEYWGGDCTNFGCIPSKTLIARAEKAHAIRNANEASIDVKTSDFSAQRVLEKVRTTIAKVRSHEDPKTLNKLGVDTITGHASFIDPHLLKVVERSGTEHQVKAKKIVIAAGGHPFIPSIDGLKDTPFLTNETIFDLKEIPKRLGIIGGGPIGCEMAQAFARLGSHVTLIVSQKGIMPREEPEVAELFASIFTQEGIALKLGCETSRISYSNEEFSICVTEKEKEEIVRVDQLLISTGRRPNTEGLNLEKGGVKQSKQGIIVDRYGRTSQHHIFAIGDIVGPPFFTHRAENHGRTVLASILLPGFLKKKLDLSQEIPRCTFTDPEVAAVGIYEKDAIEKYGKGKVATYNVSFEDVDRAICTERIEGFIKVVTKKWSSEILGATIVAPRAGEMLPEISLAMLHKIPLRKLARLIHPYPTYNSAIRKCADLWLTQTILGLLKGKKS